MAENGCLLETVIVLTTTEAAFAMAEEATYDEAKLIPRSAMDGWYLGYIGIPWQGPWPQKCGDLFVADPGGAQAGIAWESRGPDIILIRGPSPDRWGVYQVRFPHVVMCEDDLIVNFHAVLPLLKAARARALEDPGSLTS